MRIKSKTVMDQMSAEKPDDVLADLKAKHGCAAPSGSALTDAQKIEKAIELLQWMHDNCLAPDITAHDAVNTCRICRLIAELKAPTSDSTALKP